MYYMTTILNVFGKPVALPVMACKTLSVCKDQFRHAIKSSQGVEPRDSFARIARGSKRGRDYVLEVGPRGGVQVIRTSA